MKAFSAPKMAGPVKTSMPSMGKGPSMGSAPMPGAEPASLGMQKLPGAAHGAGVRPRMRLRKLSMTGKSAFPTAPAAFGDPSAAAGPGQAFSGPGPLSAAGDAGE